MHVDHCLLSIFSGKANRSLFSVDAQLTKESQNKASTSISIMGAIHGAWDSFEWVPFPEYDGKKSVAFRSADGKIVAGAAHEKGKATLVYPCDEFFFVTEGWIKCDVEGGETFTAKKGDVVYFTRGTKVNFEFGEDFYNVAIFVSTDDTKVTLV